MRRFVKIFIPAALLSFVRRLREIYFDSYRVPAYSQEGEDLILRRLLGDKKEGFYIDVGAHHPRRFSNTCIFYNQGWSGINIDALPGMKSLFDRVRARDTNVEVALSSDGREMAYTIFDDPAVSTFKAENVRWALSVGCKILEMKTVKTSTLAEVLDEHQPIDQPIDFMSVDVEGMDLEVLQSNNWGKYRPRYVLVESFGVELKENAESQVYSYLRGINYELCAKTVNTYIYKDTGR